MTDEAALLAAILADPADDTRRLAFADWLEENGQPDRPCEACKGTGKVRTDFKIGKKVDRVRIDRWELSASPCASCHGSGRVSDGRAERAEFLRVQVELAGLDECHYRLQDKEHHTARMHVRRCRWHALRRRERKLLEKSWAGQLDLGFGGGPWTDIVWTRGFVSSLTFTATAWLEHADAIFWHPAQKVPCETCGNHWWRRDLTQEQRGCIECGYKGLLPRPCPAAAQPLERVTLTTRFSGEEIIELGSLASRRLGWQVGHPLPQGLRTALAGLWPGITFELPAPQPAPVGG